MDLVSGLVAVAMMAGVVCSFTKYQLMDANIWLKPSWFRQTSLAQMMHTAWITSRMIFS